MPDKIAFAGLAAVFLGALVGALVLMSRYLPGAGLHHLYFDALLVVKAVMNLCLLMGVVAVVMQFTRGSATRTLLRLITVAAPVLGLLAALEGWRIQQAAVKAVGPVSADALAPGRVECLMALGLGALVGAIAAFGRMRQAPKPA